jgi:hypothetical protein
MDAHDILLTPKQFLALLQIAHSKNNDVILKDSFTYTFSDWQYQWSVLYTYLHDHQFVSSVQNCYSTLPHFLWT